MPTITNSLPKAPRLRWRVVVGTKGLDPSRPSRPLSWHMTDCQSPLLAEAHCPRGRELLAEGADPDGHCWIDENCPRCASLTAAAALLEAAATPSTPEPVDAPSGPSTASPSRKPSAPSASPEPIVAVP
jgi:hypothetical protein